MAKLIPSIEDITEGAPSPPYTFKMTNISVGTLEEALYHCLVYWRQSSNDYDGEEFIKWVDAIGLSDVARRIRELPAGSFSARFAAFLRVAPYIEEERVAEVEREAKSWERRLEWEKLKEAGDYLVNNGDYQQAAALYKSAAALNPDSAAVYNNAGIALMKLGRYDEGEKFFREAVKLSPSDAALPRNLAECLVLGGNFDSAREVLLTVTDERFEGDVQCLYGQIEFYSGNCAGSIPFFESALETANDPHYVFCLADAYVKLRKYEKALEIMNAAETKDKAYLKKLADIYAAYDNLPAAIRCVERALMEGRDSVDLWTRLATLHRLNYEPDKAFNAITKALSLSKNNARASLELARVKKAQGKIKDYQTVLRGVLDRFKTEYREQG